MFGLRLPWTKNRQRLEEFLAARKGIGQTDDEFVRAAASEASGEQRAMILKLRKVVAMECDVDTKVLRAEDRLEELESLFGGKDWITYLLLLRDANAFNPHNFAESLFYVFNEKNAEFRERLPREALEAISESWPEKTAMNAGPATLGRWAASLSGSLCKS